MPGLNACFVDIGSEKEAFLHYQDLGPQFNSIQKYLKQVRSNRKKFYPLSKAQILSPDGKEGNISTAVEQGQEILVQITKEPISTKGPRLTSDISFAGRFLVLILSPIKFRSHQKSNLLKSAHVLNSLRMISKKLRCDNQNHSRKRVAELDNELSALYQRWEGTLRVAWKANKPPLWSLKRQAAP